MSPSDVLPALAKRHRAPGGRRGLAVARRRLHARERMDADVFEARAAALANGTELARDTREEVEA